MLTALEEIARARELRASRWLAGRDEQGTRTTAPEESSTWIVTAVSPVLMGQPLTGGPAVSITSTDALKGVAVGMRVRVEVRGVASRVGVALVDPLPITTRDAGETVASINGRELDVGGSVNLSASDVNALPETANASDVGAATSNHRHTFTFPSLPSPPGSSTPIMSAPDPYNWTWGNNVVGWLNTYYWALRDIIAALDGVHSTDTPTT